MTHVVAADGSVHAVRSNPAVTEALLREVLLWMREGASSTDVITRLRQRTVPIGYSFHPRTPGKLPIPPIGHYFNVMSCKQVRLKLLWRWQFHTGAAALQASHTGVGEGVPFSTHIYVPETHPVTNMPFHEREDEGHVCKVHAVWYQRVRQYSLCRDDLGKKWRLYSICTLVLR